MSRTRHVIVIALSATCLLFTGGCRKAAQPAVEAAAVALPIPPTVMGLAAANQLRVVWVRTAKPGASDSFAEGKELLLMGMDTGDGRGIRQLRPQAGNFYRPLFLPTTGAAAATEPALVYTDRSTEPPQMFALPWQGGEPRPLGEGVALATWRDGANLAVWVYALEQISASARGGLVGLRMVRFRPEKPDEREIIWAETPIEAQSFQLSQDGLRAAALVPAPLAARLNLEDHTVTKLADGSWPSMAGDDSYAVAVLDTPKGNLQIFTPTGEEPYAISLASIGDMNGRFAWQPRWANDPTFLAFSGHLPKPPDDPTFDPKKDAAEAEIYLCRLNASATDFQAAVRLTDDNHGDYFPDVATFGPVPPFAKLPQKPKELVLTRGESWPAHKATAAFLWEQQGKDIPIESATPPRLSTVTPHKFAGFSRDLGLDVTQGQFSADQASTDAWASGVAASGAFTFEGIFVESLMSKEGISLRLAGLTGPTGEELFGLYRMDGKLIVRLSADETGGSIAYRPLDCHVVHDSPYHLMLTAEGGHLNVFLGGSRVAQYAIQGPGFKHWKAGGKFTIGDLDPFGKPIWLGSAFQLGLYTSALSEADITSHSESARLKIAKRRPTDFVQLEGQLLKIPTIDTSAENVLVPLQFAVQNVKMGIYLEKEVTVYFWAKRNGNLCPGLPGELGGRYGLSIEPLSQHPELKFAGLTTHKTQISEFYSIAPPNRNLKF